MHECMSNKRRGIKKKEEREKARWVEKQGKADIDFVRTKKVK